jgi:hypothetical protein
MRTPKTLYLYLAFTLVLGVACSLSSLASAPPAELPATAAPTSPPVQTTSVPDHLMEPAESVPVPAKWIDDVESSGTGPEGRAPYGDSYKLNRFERPFSRDMTYVADLDIKKFGLSEDTDWYYVSMQLIGQDPNNTVEIDYGAEIDLNADGFGDYIVWAHPPYTANWDTSMVQIFKDSNGDSAGQSATRSDAVFDGNGYDTLVFDGSAQNNADPDLAWVRMSEEQTTVIQIAFKKSLTGPKFMLGVVADGGLKDVSKFDYADHFTEADAGSSVKNNRYYPLGAVYAMDNTCWEAYGFKTTGYEPKLCQPILQPVPTSSGGGSDSACSQPPDCNGDEPGSGNYNPDTCSCE